MDWTAVLVAAIPGIIALISTTIQANKRTKQALRCLLRCRLIDLHKELRDREYLTIEEMNEVEDVYRAYHGTGGNGTGTHLYEELAGKEVR